MTEHRTLPLETPEPTVPEYFDDAAAAVERLTQLYDRAADFLLQGSCRFALVEWREERAFAQRAETIGLRYDVATRIDGYNISTGRAISIAIFRSEGTE